MRACVHVCALPTRGGSSRRAPGQAAPLIPLTARIIKHIAKEKSSEITYLQDLIYCFGNCKSIVIISDPQSAAGEFEKLS